MIKFSIYFVKWLEIHIAIVGIETHKIDIALRNPTHGIKNSDVLRLS